MYSSFVYLTDIKSVLYFVHIYIHVIFERTNIVKDELQQNYPSFARYT